MLEYILFCLQSGDNVCVHVSLYSCKPACIAIALSNVWRFFSNEKNILKASEGSS